MERKLRNALRRAGNLLSTLLLVVVLLLAVALACLFRYLPGLNLIPSGWALIFSAVGASAFCAWRFPLGREEEERGEGAV